MRKPCKTLFVKLKYSVEGKNLWLFTGIRLSSSWSPERDYFLGKIGLNRESIDWPEAEKSNNVKVDYITKNPPSISNMYGASDLSSMPVFEGGYINFGYWSESSSVTRRERVKASEELYKEVAEAANFKHNSRVVDVGCGTGVGTNYILKRYYPEQIIGLDQTPEQIQRARKKYKGELSLLSPSQFKFITGDAMQLPFSNETLTHVVSVEAAQHFPSVPKFIQESSRVLIPEGTLSFASFFATNPEGRAAASALIPDHTTHCSDECVGEVVSSMTASFKNTQIKSIGEKVWPGLERWLLKIGCEKQWTMLWPALYKAGYIDYFVFSGEKLGKKGLNSCLIRPPRECFTKEKPLNIKF